LKTPDENIREKIEGLKTLVSANKIDDAFLKLNDIFEESNNASEDTIAELNLIAAKIFFRQNFHNKSLEHLFKAKQFFELNPDDLYFDCLYFIAVNQLLLGDLSRALETCFEAIELYKKSESDFQRSEIYDLAGIIHNYIGKKETALEYHNIALEIAEKNNHTLQLGAVYNSLGNLHHETDKYIKAEKYYLKSLEYGKEIDDHNIIGTAYNNLANMEKIKENFDKAQSYYKLAISYAEKASRAYSSAEFNLNLGHLLIQLKKPEEGIIQYEEALRISKEANLKRIVRDIQKNFSEHYYNIGDYSRAVEHLEEYAKINEEIIEELSKSNVDYLNTIHKREIIQNEKKLLESKNNELNILNERLSDLNRDKIEFLGIAAHDLKNPLSSIVLLASTIKNYYGKFTKEEVQKRLDRITNTADRMQEIIKNLLDINAIESEKFIVNFAPLDLIAVLKKVIQDNEYLAHKKNIKLMFSSSASSIEIKSDSVALYQIFENLLSNSIKYSPLDKPVNIKVLQEGNKINISFEDKGIGIKPEFMPQLFKKFSRVGTKTTGGESSTGLGLSIVKKLTEACGGTVHCESEYGKGTRFIVELVLLK